MSPTTAAPQTPAECLLAAVRADPAPAAAALGISTQQVLNLARLAGHLRASYPQGPVPSFAMSMWYSHNYQPSVDWDANQYPQYALQPAECGTVACAVGHGPAAGVPARHNENWRQYVCRCFTGRHDFEAGRGEYTPREAFDSAEHPLPNDQLYKVMFHHGWSDYDDTPRGAAARICYVLQHGAQGAGMDAASRAKYAEYLP